jgi:hypothetical protein
MKITCKCGKILHADECAFHNDNYGDFSIYLCPYCRSVYPSFMLAGVASTREEKGMSDNSFQRSIEERAKQLTKKMIQMNDKVIANLSRVTDSPGKIAYERSVTNIDGMDKQGRGHPPAPLMSFFSPEP